MKNKSSIIVTIFPILMLLLINPMFISEHELIRNHSIGLYILPNLISLVIYILLMIILVYTIFNFAQPNRIGIMRGVLLTLILIPIILYFDRNLIGEKVILIKLLHCFYIIALYSVAFLSTKNNNNY